MTDLENVLVIVVSILGTLVASWIVIKFLGWVCAKEDEMYEKELAENKRKEEELQLLKEISEKLKK